MGIILKCLGEGYIHNILENWSYTNDDSTELIMKHAILYMYILTTILLIWN